MAAKVLGQAAPVATTETALYTVPGGKSVVGSSLVVCNRSSITTTFRVSVSVGGGATANKDYLAYDTPITGNDVGVLTIGYTLGAADVVRCYANDAVLSFTAFGDES